jgi:hypothetical protein
MAKNLIYIVSISVDSAKIDHNEYSEYCINTWRYWCSKNNCDLKVIHHNDSRCGRVVWNKELIFEHGKNYDKIGIVDADTMVKWDAPNVFDMFDDDFCMVRDLVNWDWVYNSISNYSKFFKGVHLDISNYGNTGVIFFHKLYLPLFEKIFNFYLSNKEELDSWDKGGGREQTILNFHLAKNNVDVKFLDGSWNVLGMFDKGWLNTNTQLKSEDLHLIKYGNIWHFTGFAIEERTKVVKYIWNLVKHNYYG